MKTDDQENQADLFKVLQENFTHARHQETLRERSNYLYWITWVAALGLLSSTTGSLNQYRMEIFLGLAVMSVVVLLCGLKWTAEYGNHLTAIACIAEDLGGRVALLL